MRIVRRGMNSVNFHAWILQNPHYVVESKFQVSTAWNTGKHFVEGSLRVFFFPIEFIDIFR